MPSGWVPRVRACCVGLGLLAGVLLGSPQLYAQMFAAGAQPTVYIGASYPSFGGYGNYSFPSYGFPSYGFAPLSGPYNDLPDHWWVSRYPINDPRQEGYNPSAGYDWGSIEALVLNAYPAKTRVTLDGVCVGMADHLGPFQLPMGEHTFRLEAPGYQPSETTLKVQAPGVQVWEVHLTPLSVGAKPAPHI